MSEVRAPATRVKADCPDCGKGRWGNVVGHFRREEHDEESSVFFNTDYRIIQCPACDTVYFQTDSVFSEDIVQTGPDEYEVPHDIKHWPTAPETQREKPSWVSKLVFVDSDLHDLMESVYKALEVDLDVLAAIGIRTFFDRSSELLKIDPASSFKDKLDKLLASGKIGGDERSILDALIDAGNAAAHRGWRPTPEELDTMLSSIEGFLQRNFILGDTMKKLAARVPTRPGRQLRKVQFPPKVGAVDEQLNDQA